MTVESRVRVAEINTLSVCVIYATTQTVVVSFIKENELVEIGNIFHIQFGKLYAIKVFDNVGVFFVVFVIE